MKTGPSCDLPVFYATHDGHTKIIADYLAQELTACGLPSLSWDVGKRCPTTADLPHAPLPLILIAPIRYGFHLAAADQFLKMHHVRAQKGPLVLLSINLTARKEAKKSKTTNAYLRKWLRKHKLDPQETFAVAGKLDYPRYSRFDRFMIQFIMTLTKGPTDPKAVVDYTPWEELKALAGRIKKTYDATQTTQDPISSRFHMHVG